LRADVYKYAIVGFELTTSGIKYQQVNHWAEQTAYELSLLCALKHGWLPSYDPFNGFVTCSFSTHALLGAMLFALFKPRKNRLVTVAICELILMLRFSLFPIFESGIA